MGAKLKYHFDCEEVIARHKAGESIKAIGEDLQVPPHTIYRQLKDYKKDWNVNNKKSGIDPLPLDIEVLKSLRDKGHTLKEIADMHNCTPSTIFRRLGYKRKGRNVRGDTATQKIVLLELKGLDDRDICVRPEDIRYIQRCPMMTEDHGKLCLQQEERVFTIVDYHDAVMKWRNALETA